MFQKLFAKLMDEAGKDIRIKGNVTKSPGKNGEITYAFDGTLELPIALAAMLEGFASREQRHELEEAVKATNHKYKVENERSRKGLSEE